MIKTMRIVTMVVALLVMGAGVFLVDAPTEMALAVKARQHFDVDQAMRHARRAVIGSGDDSALAVRALKLQAAIAMEQEHLEVAMASLTQAIALDEECWRCYLQRGDLLYRRENYADALADLKKGLSVEGEVNDKQIAYYHAREGLSFLAVGDGQSARRSARKARTLDPASPLAHFLESKICDTEGDVAKAFNYAHTAYQLGQKKRGFFSSSEGERWLKYYASVTVRYRRISD